MSIFNFLKKDVERITFETVKKYFPNATYENGILKLPDTSYDELKRKIHSVTPTVLKASFSNVEFGEMSNLNFLGVKLQIGSAKYENKTLSLPNTSFSEFKDKYPDATMEGLKKTFGTVKFGKADELTGETIEAYFPTAKFEDNKVTMLNNSFNDLKAVFPNLTAKELKAKIPNIEFGKMSSLSISDIQKEFPKAELKNGKLLIPGIKFEDFKAKFPDASTKELQARFPGYSFDAPKVEPIVSAPQTIVKENINIPTTNELKPQPAANTAATQTSEIKPPAPAAAPTPAPKPEEPKQQAPAPAPAPPEKKEEVKQQASAAPAETKAPINYDCLKIAVFSTTDHLYLRKGPNKDTLAYLLMVPGTKVIAIGVQDSWLRIIYDNFVAYCHKDYVTQDTDWKNTSMPSDKEDTYGLITSPSNSSITIDGETMKVAKDVIVENVANGNVAKADINGLGNKIGLAVKNGAGEAAYVLFRS